MVNHILKASYDRNLIITIIYQKGNEITRRNIKVVEITCDSIKAFCYLRNQVRIFKMENILSASFYKGNCTQKGNSFEALSVLRSKPVISI